MELIKSAARDESISNSDTGYVDTLVQSSGKMVLLDKLLPRLRRYICCTLLRMKFSESYFFLFYIY